MVSVKLFSLVFYILSWYFILVHKREESNMEETKKRKTKKAADMLELHESNLIKELGASAFDLLTPARAAKEIGLPVGRITDLVRQGWLASVPDEHAGPAHLYYRWRVELIKRYRRKYK
jgi:hypothetical protein